MPTQTNVWFYHSGFKAYASWDYAYIEPLVISFLRQKQFPGIVSFNQISDVLEPKMPERVNWVRVRQCISRALKLAGYEKGSDRGKAWYYESIMKLDIRKRWSRRNHRDTHHTTRSVTLLSFFPDLFPV